MFTFLYANTKYAFVWIDLRYMFIIKGRYYFPSYFSRDLEKYSTLVISLLL